MKRSGVFVGVGVLVAVAMGGCKRVPFTLKEIDAKLDSKVSKKQRKLLIQDVKALAATPLATRKGSAFEKIFGGTDSIAVLGFLNERVNYVLPESVKITDRLVELNDSEPEEKPEEPRKLRTMATNVGSAIWMVLAKLKEESGDLSPGAKIGVRIGKKKIPVNSTRVGIIQLGSGYAPDFASSVNRMDTLVHEARHSDCTGGITRAQLRDLEIGNPPEGACMHAHAKCPAGHPLEGNYACDGKPWGAYAVGAIFSIAIAKGCESCGETTKQEALVSAVDGFSRVLVNVSDMAEGKLGEPDMTSAGVID